MRRSGIVLLSVLTAPFILMPTGTAFAADQPVVNWANSDPNDLGTLEVSVTSAQDITHLKAHIISPSNGQEVAATEDFVLRSGTAKDGVWATRDTLKLDALGYYSVNVDATTADGSQATAAGSLSYYAQTVFDPLVADRSTVSYAHRDATIRSRLMSRSPATRQLTPFANAPMWLNVTDYDRIGNPVDLDGGQLHTDADGRFSYSRSLKGKTDFYVYYPYANEFPGYLAGNTNTLVVDVHPSPVRVTATANPLRVNAGGQVAISGRATWKSPTGWQPLTGATFTIGKQYPGQQVTTDADGRYSATLVPYISDKLPVTYVTQDPFMADASTTADVIVAQPSAIREFGAERGDQAGTVTLTGNIDFPGPESPAEAQIHIEFSPDGTTWTSKTTVSAVNGFSSTVEETRPGYWRARYLGGRDFQPATSETVYFDPR
ncbi:hypothetical protein GCM10029978_031150 [Actinoallomurus acanthiterrae]